jgi:hypothetical protein
LSDDREDSIDQEGETPYKVGYKRPPPWKKWKKGQTGNPNKINNLAKFGKTLMDELEKTIEAKVNGKTVRRQRGALIAQQMAADAIDILAPPWSGNERPPRVHRRSALQGLD